jgi:hypothetical protein
MTQATPEEAAEFAAKIENMKAQEKLIKLQNNYRIHAFALLEAGMRAREGHWREDIANFREQLELNEAQSTNKAKQDKGYAKRVEKKHDFLVNEFKRRTEHFNFMVYKEIEDLNRRLKDSSKDLFDNLSAMFGDLLLEFSEAKNKADMLRVCKMYNLGYLDTAIEHFKNIQEEVNSSVGELTPAPEPTQELTVVKDDLTNKIHPFPGKGDTLPEESPAQEDNNETEI